MKAVILCAGEGERMKPLTKKTPKPLLLFKNKAILSHILLSLPENIEEIFIVIKEKNKKIFENFLNEKWKNKKIKLVFQPENLKGTYYALWSAKIFLLEEDKFLVLNGDDIFLKNDLENLLKEKAPCYGISFKRLDKGYRTADLDINQKTITSFRKPKESEKDKELICFSGALTLNKNFFTYQPVFYENKEAGLPHTLFNQTENVYFYILKSWIQINKLEDLT